MSVHYLVDYENVHESGIYGMGLLAPEDSVYLFHTSTTDRITLSCLDDVRAWVKVILVPPGKQSLDMHLGSFLGYLIGKEEDPETRYAVVSKDTDYRGITDFWNYTFQMGDKVQCIHSISGPLAYGETSDTNSVSMTVRSEKIAVREFILRAFESHGFISRNGRPCMLVSELCTLLNSLPAYSNARKRTGKRPLQYLRDECRDILWVDRKWSQDWVYLLGSSKSEAIEAETEEPRQAEAAEERRQETIPEETVVAEETIPDIMELGDLTIDDEPVVADEPAGEEPAPDETAEKLQAEDDQEEPDLLACALTCLLNVDAERNAAGHVRASVLRNELMKYPEFRRILKESGMKPIPFIAQLFPEQIRVYREKGIYRAAAGRGQEKDAPEEERKNPVVEDRQKKFFEQAFASIRNRLSEVGLDQNVADEITDICMQSYTDMEPRKVIHNLLCERYGNRIGAQYYRKAVKYADILPRTG